MPGDRPAALVRRPPERRAGAHRPGVRPRRSRGSKPGDVLCSASSGWGVPELEALRRGLRRIPRPERPLLAFGQRRHLRAGDLLHRRRPDQLQSGQRAVGPDDVRRAPGWGPARGRAVLVPAPVQRRSRSCVGGCSAPVLRAGELRSSPAPAARRPLFRAGPRGGAELQSCRFPHEPGHPERSLAVRRPRGFGLALRPVVEFADERRRDDRGCRTPQRLRHGARARRNLVSRGPDRRGAGRRPRPLRARGRKRRRPVVCVSSEIDGHDCRPGLHGLRRRQAVQRVARLPHQRCAGAVRPPAAGRRRPGQRTGRDLPHARGLPL